MNMFWNFWQNTKWMNFFKKRSWSNRKIAFVAMLIATSVSFVLIFANLIPIAAIPSFKYSIVGLPIKLSGYIFGPFIGILTGIISDSLSFALRPTFWHYSYMIAFALAGFIPGVVGYFMNKKWVQKSDVKKSDVKKPIEEKYNNVNFIFTLIILSLIIVSIFCFIYFQGENVFKHQKIITNKWIFLTIATLGIGSMIIAVIIFRFVLKPKTFNLILPIIVFSALLEIVNTPLISFGDYKVLTSSRSFITILTGHFLLSPAKIWTNLFVILISYKIVSPLIYNKANNGWKRANF